VKGGLLVAGTSSDAGKSVVTAGICRWLARQGVRVAPFKAQNMSLNSAVTRDGAEIGRAQAAQAAAAGVPAEAAMNPILLKPTSEHASQVVVLGKPSTVADTRAYGRLRPRLREVALDALASLRSRFDVVVCEGAGSPAEINLRAGDLANLGLARAAGLPVLLVGDIDRGGVFAALHGTVALLEPADQALVAGFLVNKFRGDPELLAPGLRQLGALTGRPVLGVLPWVPGLWLDAEDSLALDPPWSSIPPAGGDPLLVAVVRLPWISNFTDLDALATEPGVAVRFTDAAADLAAADLVVVPGTKATVADLGWLRSRGLDRALTGRAARGDPILGVCGGYQLLGRRIVDRVESGAGEVEGLGLLPVETVFAPDKTLATPAGTVPWLGGVPAAGYEIHHGRTRRLGGEALVATARGEEGCRVGPVLGTSWHGLLEGDRLRRALLGWVAELRGLDFAPGTHRFADVRAARLDRLADLIAEHADTAALARLIEQGPPPGSPVVPPGGSGGPGAGGAPAPPSGPWPPGEADGPDVTPAARVRPPGELLTHGDAMVRAGQLDFAVNVVPGGPPSWLRRELASALGRLGGYPDERPAAAAVAARHGRTPAETVLLNGAAEAFWLLAAVLRPRRPVVVHPCFTAPEAALLGAGHRVARAFREPDRFALDPGAVPAGADLVVLGNPNNPTGNLDPAVTIAGLARPGRVLVVDEAFMDLSPGEPESLAGRADLPGLVVVRSLTKVWALAGLRAGYLLAPPPLAAALRAARQPWSVNALALAALTACAGDAATPARAAAAVATARAELAAGLAALPGVTVWPSAANFLLLRVPDGPRVLAALSAAGIAVRRADTFPGLGQDHLRVAVRPPADNRRLLAALADALR
jgi:adenosylcobyric acid synthase